MKIRNYFQPLGITFIIITLVSYGILGGSAFPDYNNYITLAEHEGWLFDKNEYFFEWISRGILIYSPKFGFEAQSAVNILATVNQIVCSLVFCSLILSKDVNKSIGTTLLFSLVGFLFLTTTIRAAPAYLALTILAIRNLKLDLRGVIIIFFGLAWHDSFIVPIIGIIITHAVAKSNKLSKIREQLSLDKIIHLISAGSLLFASQIREAALSVIGFDTGIRAVYFESNGAQNIVKMTYCAVAILVCANTYNDKSVNYLNRTLATILSIGVAMSYLVSGTAAVRFSMFVFCAFIPIRGVFAFEFERKLLFRPLIFIIAIGFLFFSAFDTLSKTE